MLLHALHKQGEDKENKIYGLPQELGVVCNSSKLINRNAGSKKAPKVIKEHRLQI